MNYPLTREYCALLRYNCRHQDTNKPAVDPNWVKSEMQSIAFLLAHDVRPSEEEYDAISYEYGIITYFPFEVEHEP